MANKYLIGLLFILFEMNTASQFAYAQGNWEKLTPQGLQSIEAAEIDENGNIYVGTWLDGVYHSTDNGRTWITNNKSDYPLYIWDIIVTEAGTIICGCEDKPVYRSTDNGITWNVVQSGGEDVSSIAVDSQGWLYIANGDAQPGFYRSKDDGANWQQLQMGDDFNSWVHDIEITPDDDIYFPSKGSPENFLYYSTDFGDNFTKTGLDQGSYNIEVDSQGTIYLTGKSGLIFCSSNTGLLWDTLQVTNSTLYALELDTDDNIYAGGDGDTMYISTDHGITWESERIGIDSTVMSINELKSHNEFIYAATVQGLFRKQIGITGLEPHGQPPENFNLKQNYPNPCLAGRQAFNPSTTIEYKITALTSSLSLGERVSGGRVRGNITHQVSLKVYDILGQEVATLVNKRQRPGNYKVNFNASGLSSGVYYYQLTVGDYTATRKMIVLK